MTKAAHRGLGAFLNYSRALVSMKEEVREPAAKAKLVQPERKGRIRSLRLGRNLFKIVLNI